MLRRPPAAGLTAAAALLAAVALPAVSPSAVSLPAARASQAVCGMSAVTVSAGSYVVQSNEYGSRAPQCVTADGGADFAVTVSGVSAPTDSMPAGYPSIYAGCHWGRCTSTGLGTSPVRVSALRAGTVTTTWVTAGPWPRGGAWDASYDIWFDSTPRPAAPDGVEMMLWLRRSGPVTPAGARAARGVRVGGMTCDIWWRPPSGGSLGTVSYVLTRPRSAVYGLRIAALARNAAARGYLRPWWYLADIEAGFELWRGGKGLQTRDFSVTVRR